MGQFYYTVASLPMLSYGEQPGLTVADYLADCHKWLKPAEWDLLSTATLVPDSTIESDSVSADEFRKWEISLRNELVLLRASAMGLEPDIFTKKSERYPDTASLAAHAFKQESPMDAEDALNRGRWQFLENLKVGHFFDLDFLILYSLQLQILERKSCFDEETGFARYQEIYQNILNQLDDDAVGEQE